MKKTIITSTNTVKGFAEKNAIDLPFTVKPIKERVFNRIAAGFMTVVTAISTAVFATVPAAAAPALAY